MRLKELQDYQKETIRGVRKLLPDILNIGLLDTEIANTYSFYCELFYAAGWTDCDLKKFVNWASITPFDHFKGE